MAKRVRNYKLEHQRRNERARAQGFASYAAQRKAKESQGRPRGGKPRNYAAEYARRKARKLIDRYERAFGQQSRYNRKNILNRIPDFDEDELDELKGMSDAEFKRLGLMTAYEAQKLGIPYEKPRTLHYH